jgi:hypothetical protein
VNNKQETTIAQKSTPFATSTAFRPVNTKQETTTTHKNSPVKTSTPLRSTNAKQEPTQKSVKNILDRYNQK